MSEGGLVLYDLSSSYFEGTPCPLARLGLNRDGKKGLLQVNYGLLTDTRGYPVAIDELRDIEGLGWITALKSASICTLVELCMLAYYVEWLMRKAWRELMFADTDQASKATRDLVASAKRSAKALGKVASHTLDDGAPAHSFSTLMAELASIVRAGQRRAAPGSAGDALPPSTRSQLTEERDADASVVRKHPRSPL